MITKIHGKFVFQCDGGCDACLDTQRSDFYAALEVLKSERWTNKKVGKEYEHRCPDCSDGS